MLQQCEPWPLWDVHWVMMFLLLPTQDRIEIQYEGKIVEYAVSAPEIYSLV